MLPSVKQVLKWCALYLMLVLAGVVNLHTVESREVSSISVDLIENGKEKEAIIDLKQKNDKTDHKKKHKDGDKKGHKKGKGKDKKEKKNKTKKEKKHKENEEEE